MLTALLLLALFFGLVQELKIPGNLRGFSVGKGRKQGVKPSTLVSITGKPKS